MAISIPAGTAHAGRLFQFGLAIKLLKSQLLEGEKEMRLGMQSPSNVLYILPRHGAIRMGDTNPPRVPLTSQDQKVDTR